MTIKPSQFYGLSDEQLLESMGGAQAGSPMDHAVNQEFMRRASVAQRAAADAARDTAWWTKFSALAIAASVFVMAIGTIIQTAIAMRGV